MESKAVRENRKAWTGRDKQRPGEISAILFRYDPSGINFADTDESDASRGFSVANAILAAYRGYRD